jgi:hypothetical protein
MALRLRLPVQLPRLDQIPRTLSRASDDMMAFLVIFMINYIGFCVAFYLAFGAEM